MLSLPGGFGVWGVSQLLQLPELPDCISQLNLKDSTASVFYCATKTADDLDANKLSKAIELVNSLPTEHPQRSMSDRMIEKWSQAILRLGETAFQQGDIDKAVDMVKLIPDNVSAHQLANNQIEKWKSIWSKGEAIYDAAVAKVQENDRDNSYLALIKAKELLNLGNDFWATTKYQELIHKIQEIKEKNVQARAQEEKYRLAETKKQLEIINTTEQEQQAQDLAQLNKARKEAKSGNIEDMKDAITQASMIVSGHYYDEAQEFITNTKRQIEIASAPSSHKVANELANKNDAESLQTAINQARLITDDRPLYKEANEHIAKWNQQILKVQQSEKQKVLFKGDRRNSQVDSTRLETVSEVEDKYLQNVKP